jgi:hydroxymethylbilane synthase
MHVALIGINHKSASTEIREKLSIPASTLTEVLRHLISIPFIEECLALSTCNRTEIYVASYEQDRALDELSKYLSLKSAIPLAQLQKHLYRHTSMEAAAHLFRVFAGIDSMLLGENEIHGQLLEAWKIASEEKTCRSVLDALFHKAASCSKKIRCETNLSSGTVSSGSAVVALAKTFPLGDRELPQVLIIGAGQIAEIVARRMQKNFSSSLNICNRTAQRAQDLAHQINAGFVSYHCLEQELIRTDLVVSCTSSSEMIITASQLRAVMKQRKHRALYIIDMAMPLDIDPEAQNIEHLHLFTLDDLQDVIHKGLELRKASSRQAEEIIQKQLQHFPDAFSITPSKTIRIGTRDSLLALSQTQQLCEQLKKRFPSCKWELVPVKTRGDLASEIPLYQMGGEGVFVKYLETLLLSNEIDMAVHSLKDLPVVLPEGLILAAIPERLDPSDALITPTGLTLDKLVTGAVIGTGSLRRRAQLLAYRRDLCVQHIRGNVDTRIQKMHQQHMDGIILASAGLLRLGREAYISQNLPYDLCLPAVGQGALGIEIRQSDSDLKQCLTQIQHEDSALAVTAERSLLKNLGGGCHLPIAGLAEICGHQLKLRGLVADPDGNKVIRQELHGNKQEAEALGQTLAELLLRQGARELYRK